MCRASCSSRKCNTYPWTTSFLEGYPMRGISEAGLSRVPTSSKCAGRALTDTRREWLRLAAAFSQRRCSGQIGGSRSVRPRLLRARLLQRHNRCRAAGEINVKLAGQQRNRQHCQREHRRRHHDSRRAKYDGQSSILPWLSRPRLRASLDNSWWTAPYAIRNFTILRLLAMNNSPRLRRGYKAGYF